jgi:hypothetical protein
MAVSALAPATQAHVGRPQSPFALSVIALAGAAAAAAVFTITSDIDEQAPLADAALVRRRRSSSARILAATCRR